VDSNAANGGRLSQTHPNLYGALMVVAVANAALGLNFIFLKPSFNPLGIPKGPTGAVFLILGVGQAILLNLRYLWARRVAVSAGVAVRFFWFVALFVAFFTEKQTSLQLPIFVLEAVGVAYFLVLEPYINPVTDKNGNGGKQ
jgi:hypothetical protein